MTFNMAEIKAMENPTLKVRNLLFITNYVSFFVFLSRFKIAIFPIFLKVFLKRMTGFSIYVTDLVLTNWFFGFSIDLGSLWGAEQEISHYPKDFGSRAESNHFSCYRVGTRTAGRWQECTVGWRNIPFVR